MHSINKNLLYISIGLFIVGGSIGLFFYKSKKSKTNRISQEFNTINQQAKKAFIHKNLSKALSLYNSALELELLPREKSQILKNRSITFQKLKRFEEALSDASLAITISPKYINAHFSRACILYEIGRYQEASNDLSIVLNDDKWSSRADVQKINNLLYEKLHHCINN